jgi:hypothetical protein
MNLRRSSCPGLFRRGKSVVFDLPLFLSLHNPPPHSQQVDYFSLYALLGSHSQPVLAFNDLRGYPCPVGFLQHQPFLVVKDEKYRLYLRATLFCNRLDGYTWEQKLAIPDRVSVGYYKHRDRDLSVYRVMECPNYQFNNKPKQKRERARSSKGE